jgi:predicted esterase
MAFFLSLLFFSADAQKLFEGKIDIQPGRGVDRKDAIIYLPANYSKNKKYPLVIFTHGIGESGNDIKKVYKHGLPKVLKNGYRPPFEFIMVALQGPKFSVSPYWLPGILEDCQKQWSINTNRIYLTGLSAGAWGTYGSQLNISPEFASKFAAIVVYAGAAESANRRHLDWWGKSKTPLWAVVGKNDKVFVRQNTYMVSQINKRVPRLATLTIRPGVGHGGWDDMYKGNVKLNGKNMWEWLYQFDRSNKNFPKPSGSKPEPIPVPQPTPGVAKFIKVNIAAIGNSYTNSEWNNWIINNGLNKNLSLNRLKYTDRTTSPVSVYLSHSQNMNDNTSRYGGGMAPAEVLRHTTYYHGERKLVITGLSRSKKYSLELYSSGWGYGNTTKFTVNNQSRTIPIYKNLHNKALFTNLSPNTEGKLIVTISNVGYYSYLNGFTITEK